MFGFSKPKYIFLKVQVLGIRSDHYVVEINFKNETCDYTAIRTDRLPISENPDIKDKIMEFSNKLRELEIEKWDDHYEKKTIGGRGWEVTLVTSKNTIRKSGSSSFPDNWDEFCKAIESLIGYPFK